jgi:hypothetical protein
LLLQLVLLLQLQLLLLLELLLLEHLLLLLLLPQELLLLPRCITPSLSLKGPTRGLATSLYSLSCLQYRLLYQARLLQCTHTRIHWPSLAHPSLAHPSLAHASLAHPSLAHASLAHPSLAHASLAHVHPRHPLTGRILCHVCRRCRLHLQVCGSLCCVHAHVPGHALHRSGWGAAGHGTAYWARYPAGAVATRWDPPSCSNGCGIWNAQIATSGLHTWPALHAT